MTLQAEAFALCLNEGEMSGDARQDSSHSASNSLLDSFERWQLLLIERRVPDMAKNYAGRAPFLQLDGAVFDEELAAGNRHADSG